MSKNVGKHKSIFISFCYSVLFWFLVQFLLFFWKIIISLLCWLLRRQFRMRTCLYRDISDHHRHRPVEIVKVGEEKKGEKRKRKWLIKENGGETNSLATFSIEENGSGCINFRGDWGKWRGVRSCKWEEGEWERMRIR